MNFQEIATNLQFSDGIWYSKTINRVSYPEDGNQNTFLVEENSFWFLHRNHCIAELVKRFSPNSCLFDIGGGNGKVSQALENEGIETVLVEPGKAGILNAKKRNIKNLICSTLEDAAFIPGSIPSIGLFDVLEHVEDDNTFLNELNRLLIPNGKIYISVPAYSLLWSNDDDLGGHYRRYNLNLLEKKLTQTGFTILYKTYIFCALPIPIFLLRSIPSRLGLSKNQIVVAEHKRIHSGMAILNKVHQWELRRIQKWKTIPFGGSCLIAASKSNGASVQSSLQHS
jgi:2-polyprenyl-3-methyl-5-hydroxy-6-metoxy-1,4-benzoquinol methylase